MKKIKIKEIIDIWKKDKVNYVKKSTYSAYALIVENHILPHFGDKFVFDESDVQEFVMCKIKWGLKQKTIKDILVVIKMIFKFGVKHGYMEYKDIHINFPTNEKSKNIETFDKHNYKILLDYLKQNFSFKNLGIYICLLTGMRIGEICGLMWKDFDLHSGSIKVERIVERIYVIDGNSNHTELITSSPKTINAVRDIPISADLKSILKPLIKITCENYFVLSNNSKPIEPRNYRNYYNSLLKKLDIQHLKFHALRHSFASRCIEARCDYKTVSSILGHSNISTTLNLYVHPNLEQKKRCVEQMWRAIK